MYEDIIIEIHDHYKPVFAKTQTPPVQDTAKAYNFAHKTTKSHNIGTNN